jgi:DNA repair photolyase
MPAILKAAASAGASFAGFGVVRLPHAVKEIFEAWLREREPLKAEKVLHRIREVRGGRLNDPRFGSRMSGEGVYAEQVGALFELARKKAGIPAEGPELSTASFRVPPGPQLTLF